MQYPVRLPISVLSTFPPTRKKKTESILLQDLKNIINQNGEGTSFFDYRMKMLNFPQEADKIRKRIETYFQVVNSFLGETNKEISIDPQSNSLVFLIKRLEGMQVITEDKIQLEQLSSGEKQILLILTTVFLQEEKPNVLLMDEPEISLHIGWQDKLIEKLRLLNLNAS